MSKKIFVVEDDALTVNQLQLYIEEMGHQFAGTADQAAAALEQIGQTKPDLVLMDIRLPGAMDGIEVAAKLRADCAAAVIYLTAYADDNTLARAKLTEPFGYLVKPFTKQELKASIEIGLYKSEAEAKFAEQCDVLRRLNVILMEREMRIIEVKHEVNELLAQVGQPPRYPSAESDGAIS